MKTNSFFFKKSVRPAFLGALVVAVLFSILSALATPGGIGIPNTLNYSTWQVRTNNTDATVKNFLGTKTVATLGTAGSAVNSPLTINDKTNSGTDLIVEHTSGPVTVDARVFNTGEIRARGFVSPGTWATVNLPATCTDGAMTWDSTALRIKICQANVWSEISAASDDPMIANVWKMASGTTAIVKDVAGNTMATFVDQGTTGDMVATRAMNAPLAVTNEIDTLAAGGNLTFRDSAGNLEATLFDNGTTGSWEVTGAVISPSGYYLGAGGTAPSLTKSGTTIVASGQLTSTFLQLNTMIFGVSQSGRIEGYPTASQYGRLDLDNLNTSTAQASLSGNMATGASAIGVILNNRTTFSTAGARCTSIQNNGTEKFGFKWDSGIVFATTIKPAAADYGISQDGSNLIFGTPSSKGFQFNVNGSNVASVDFSGTVIAAGINVPSGSGSTLTSRYSYSTTLDFPLHGPLDTSALTFTGSGATSGDHCKVTTNLGSMNGTVDCYVTGSGANNITVVEACINGAAGTCNTGSQIYHVEVTNQ